MEIIEKLEELESILKYEGFEQFSEPRKDIRRCIVEFKKIERLFSYLNQEKEKLNELMNKYNSEGKSEHSLCVKMKLDTIDDVLFYITRVLEIKGLTTPIQ